MQSVRSANHPFSVDTPAVNAYDGVNAGSVRAFSGKEAEMNTNDDSAPIEAESWPLREVDYAAVRQATHRRTVMKRAAHVASNSGKIAICIGVSAVCLSMTWWSWPGIIVGTGAAVIGIIEWMGGRRVKSGKAEATRLLAVNQLALFALVTAYCVFHMVTFSPEKAKAEAISPQVRSDLAIAMPDLQYSIDHAIDTWGTAITVGFYSLVIAASIGFQGGMALYYLSRRKHIDAWNRETPAWIKRLFAEMGL